MKRVIAIGWVLWASTASGAEIEQGGLVAADGRAYLLGPLYDDQAPGHGVSLLAQPRLALVGESWSATVEPFLRLDPIDSARTHWDLRRADLLLSWTNVELSAGVGIFRWRVLESHGLVDILNQADLVERLDGSQKLGQPYAQLAWISELWALRLFALPYHRGVTLPGARGRNRFAAIVDGDQAIYETDLAEWEPSFAIRFSANVGAVDLGLGLFSGVSREPRFLAQLTSAEIVPAYDRAQQASLDLAWAHEALVLKLEAMGRLWSEDLRFFAAVGTGIEYTFFDVFGSGADLTSVGEVILDGRPLEAPVTIYDHDGFVGFRLGINDTASTELTGGAVADLLDGRTYLRAQVQRRFGESWSLVAQINAFLGAPGEMESALLRDHHALIRLSYFL